MDATTNNLDSVLLGFIVRVDLPTGPIHFWTGEYTREFDEVEYIGASGIFNIIANRGTTPRLRMRLGTEAFTEAFRKPTGPARIVMQAIGSLDFGNNWQPLDFVLRGKLSAPRIQGITYEVDIMPERYFPTARTWSAEDHQKLHPEDTIFSQQRLLSDGKIEDDFGNVPIYDHSFFRGKAVKRGEVITTPGGGAPVVPVSGVLSRLDAPLPTENIIGGL